MTILLFDSCGNVQFTRGQGLTKLAPLYQNIEMRRVTEIHMESCTRKFFIEWKISFYGYGERGINAGDWHYLYQHRCVWGSELSVPCVPVILRDEDSLFLFDTYEDAVTYEISCLDELRRKGVIFQ